MKVQNMDTLLQSPVLSPSSQHVNITMNQSLLRLPEKPVRRSSFQEHEQKPRATSDSTNKRAVLDLPLMLPKRAHSGSNSPSRSTKHSSGSRTLTNIIYKGD